MHEHNPLRRKQLSLCSSDGMFLLLHRMSYWFHISDLVYCMIFQVRIRWIQWDPSNTGGRYPSVQ